jgi:hypothetical protein
MKNQRQIEAVGRCLKAFRRSPERFRKRQGTGKKVAKRSQYERTPTQAKEAWAGHPAPHVKSYFDDANRLAGPPAFDSDVFLSTDEGAQVVSLLVRSLQTLC